MTTFNELNLNINTIDGLKKQDINEPTEVQTLAIPKILEHKDLLVNAQTGSGKTLAYLLPMFEKIDSTKRETQVLVLAPTHELVMQIVEQAKILSTNSNMDVTAFSLIGEVNIQKQIKNIKAIKPHIVVGTCGRVLDLIQQKKLKAHNIKTIILDEVDSLLSGNNVSTVKSIIKTTLRDRQVLGFSASLNDNTIDICNSIMKEPQIIKTKSELVINPNIDHMYLYGEQREKFTLLRKSIAATNPKRAIIFVNDEDSIEIITSKLNHHDYKAVGIFGKMAKEDRKNALNAFKIGKAKILVSTDLSARGLDIVDITHVFNLDFPKSKNEYIHRSGRTARGNRKGDTISIVTSQNLATIRDYKREFNISIKAKELKEGKLVDFVSSQGANNKKQK
ncbi:DEAD/DEAH box helicase [Romboutsia sedimentorum]|jgi:superfamily II DNA/RNA helicase|uniref:DEAD/DEAH box helicase n=1 Tax=Romboutsia sedimentorum TaxID=1368474 RepID=A0ABT7ED06_9FIRM|nr:DEAD/DEAH box helicase [Romboutsia sedimentorum]MDK2563978.1 DEAD/DEAH box helicase [Romboutsia sedimentorum]MDK2585279.1 DEAD/DEAH box helicase [Romboutsia sedimentorum]